jgi:hypothetical protein
MGGRKRQSTARAGTAELLGWCQYEGVESNLRLCLIVYFVLLWIKGTSGCPIMYTSESTEHAANQRHINDTAPSRIKISGSL